MIEKFNVQKEKAYIIKELIIFCFLIRADFSSDDDGYDGGDSDSSDGSSDE